MSGVIASPPVFAPHLLQDPRTFPTHLASFQHFQSMSSRKRKADDDGQGGDNDERMSASPSSSPAMASRVLPPAQRQIKRVRTNLTGRHLSLPRLLETLSPDEMRGLLRSICERHPDIGAEVVSTAPRPSVQSALNVLNNYEAALQGAFPFGNRPSSDYAYNRVKQPLSDLLDALKDYTPHFLPPNETTASTSLSFLDGATEIIHKLPNWDSFQHNGHKHDAYEEISKAWVLVIREAAKKGGGMQLQYGGWDQKLAKHNQISGGKMDEAVLELRKSLGWIGGDGGNPASPQGASNTTDPASIRQQLFSGNYGNTVRVGPW